MKRIRFANEGSALRASSRSNPRIYECPTCKRPNMLTAQDVARHYQCDSCANECEYQDKAEAEAKAQEARIYAEVERTTRNPDLGKGIVYVGTIQEDK